MRQGLWGASGKMSLPVGVYGAIHKDFVLKREIR